MDLNRTQRSRFVLYETDGRGRDTYIRYNNGGFWKENINYIYFKPNYGSQHRRTMYNLRHNAAPFRYYSDGSGRDTYILTNDGGLKKNHLSLKNYNLKDFLRTPESCIFNFKSNPLKEGVRIKTHYLSKNEFENNNSIRNIEKGLINRLYTSQQHKRNKVNNSNSIHSGNNRVSQTEGNYNQFQPQKEFRYGRKKVRVTLDPI